MKFIEVTKLNWNQTMEEPIRFVFYIVSYQVVLARKEEKERKKLMKKHGRN